MRHLVFSGVRGLARDPARRLAITPLEWWAVLAAILVIGLKLLLIPLDPTLFGWAGPAGLIVAGELTGLVLLWWLGVEHSPLGRGLPVAGDFYPLVTAIATLVIADRNRFTPWSGLARLTSPLVLVLAPVSSAMTLGRVDATTVFTLALVAMALVIWAISQGDLRSAILGGVAWLSAGAVAGLVVDQRFGLTAIDSRAIGAAVGILVAIYTLWALAGWLRRRTDLSQTVALSSGLECVGFVGAVLAAGLVAVAAVSSPMAVWTAYAGIGSLLAVALFFVLLVPRWRAEWLVYLAQTAPRGGVRGPSAGPSASPRQRRDRADPVRLHRHGHRRGARPAAPADLRPAHPVHLAGAADPAPGPARGHEGRGRGHRVPSRLGRDLLRRGLRDAPVEDARVRRRGPVQRRALGLWGQMGWQLADHPQFFLVPVGLSTILFAEANRRELGRETVNTIRTAGLIVTYLAMAAPIWQYRSFGDWVALLIGSLVGLFVGIGLRVQTFVWLGLVTFLADVLYELGQVSLDHALAKWAIMLSLGILLVFFVALNEKKQIVTTMRGYLAEVRSEVREETSHDGEDPATARPAKDGDRHVGMSGTVHGTDLQDHPTSRIPWRGGASGAANSWK